MIRDEFVAFDDEIRGNQVIYYTSDRFMTRLAAYDLMAVSMDVRSASFASTVGILANLEHSGDGLHFTTKFLNAGLNAVLVDWHSLTSYPGAQQGYDDGTFPGLPFMRIAMQGYNIGGLGNFVSARVRIYVTLRDIGGGKPFAVERGYR